MKRKKKQGGYRKTVFGDLVKTDPERAAVMLRDVWVLEMSATKAAKKLDISRGSFFRCARRLESMGFGVGRPSEPSNARIDPAIPWTKKIFQVGANRP